MGRDLLSAKCGGLDSTVSVLSTVTDFIENYYQVPDNLLRAFENNEVRGDKYKPRPSLGGSYESQPGYLRLTADRSVFESLDTALVYTRHWEKLWQLLKVSLCAGLEFVPDMDLAVRRRVVNGVKTHPLKQQFTATGLEPARLWLARYKRADEAGRAFQAQVGFDCGLIFDDVGHISIAMDCLHPALAPPPAPLPQPNPCLSATCPLQASLASSFGTRCLLHSDRTMDPPEGLPSATAQALLSQCSRSENRF